ncbi:MAG: hypothetical protein K0S26_2203 [Bacteroidota bacterium]|nr:hypothetical protein [Bacteroidota bacterium]
MLKRPVYLLCYLVIYFNSYSQINLIPNPSFEDTVGACFVQMNINNAKFWYKAKATPDLYNECANFFSGNPYPNAASIPQNCYGYQTPHLGESYAGIGLYSLNYLPDSVKIANELAGVKLREPLKFNQCYYGEFYLSLGNINMITLNTIGMLFTQNTYTLHPDSFNNLVSPQIQWDTTQYFTDTLNWIKVSGTFIAQGGEEYLTIGNFKDGAHVKKKFISTGFVTPCGISNPNSGVYVFIDDIALYEIPSPQLSFNSITMCPDADSLLLGDTARIQTSYQWFANGGLIATTSSITVKPDQTTTYVLQTTQCNTSTQTVVVTYSSNCEPVVVVEPIIPNVFTPNNDSINDVWRFNLGKGNTLKSLSIYNRWGNDLTPSFYQLEHSKATTVLWDGRTTSGEQTPGGVYFYMLQYVDANGEEHRKNGYITLIR